MQCFHKLLSCLRCCNRSEKRAAWLVQMSSPSNQRWFPSRFARHSACPTAFSCSSKYAVFRAPKKKKGAAHVGMSLSCVQTSKFKFILICLEKVWTVIRSGWITTRFRTRPELHLGESELIILLLLPLLIRSSNSDLNVQHVRSRVLSNSCCRWLRAAYHQSLLNEHITFSSVSGAVSQNTRGSVRVLHHLHNSFGPRHMSGRLACYCNRYFHIDVKSVDK